MKTMTNELKALGEASGSHVMDLTGVGPIVAARVLADPTSVT